MSETTEVTTTKKADSVPTYAIRVPLGDARDKAREAVREAQLAIVRAAALADVRIEGSRIAQPAADKLADAARLLDQADATLRDVSAY